MLLDLKRLFDLWTGVEIITFPNIDPLINHVRIFGSLFLVGDCPEQAPKWSGVSRCRSYLRALESCCRRASAHCPSSATT